MVLDRRALLLGVGSSMVVACSGRAADNGHDTSANTSSAAGQRKVSKVTGGNPSLIPGLWAGFKGSYVQPDGRVIDTGNKGVSHTEGQGYALVLAATAGDRDGFDRVLAWTEKTLARSSDPLFFWRYDPNAPDPLADKNNATDGDMLIAWGLMLGAERWRERFLAERAAAIRNALHDTMLRQVGGDVFLIPGGQWFEEEGRLTLNPSYYVWPALQRFAAVDGDKKWGPVMKGGETLLARARFGQHGLPTDWVDLSPDGTMAPTPGRDPRFGFDAIRVPLYLVMAGMGSKADAIARFWRGYEERPIPAWIDVRTGQTAEYALSTGAMVGVRRLLGKPLPAPQLQADYYGSVLQALAFM